MHFDDHLKNLNIDIAQRIHILRSKTLYVTVGSQLYVRAGTAVWRGINRYQTMDRNIYFRLQTLYLIGRGRGSLGSSCM